MGTAREQIERARALINTDSEWRLDMAELYIRAAMQLADNVQHDLADPRLDAIGTALGSALLYLR